MLGTGNIFSYKKAKPPQQAYLTLANQQAKKIIDQTPLYLFKKINLKKIKKINGMAIILVGEPIFTRTELTFKAYFCRDGELIKTINSKTLICKITKPSLFFLNLEHDINPKNSLIMHNQKNATKLYELKLSCLRGANLLPNEYLKNILNGINPSKTILEASTQLALNFIEEINYCDCKKLAIELSIALKTHPAIGKINRNGHFELATWIKTILPVQAEQPLTNFLNYICKLAYQGLFQENGELSKRTKTYLRRHFKNDFDDSKNIFGEKIFYNNMVKSAAKHLLNLNAIFKPELVNLSIFDENKNDTALKDSEKEKGQANILSTLYNRFLENTLPRYANHQLKINQTKQTILSQLIELDGTHHAGIEKMITHAKSKNPYKWQAVIQESGHRLSGLASFSGFLKNLKYFQKLSSRSDAAHLLYWSLRQFNENCKFNPHVTNIPDLFKSQQKRFASYLIQIDMNRLPKEHNSFISNNPANLTNMPAARKIRAYQKLLTAIKSKKYVHKNLGQILKLTLKKKLKKDPSNQSLQQIINGNIGCGIFTATSANVLTEIKSFAVDPNVLFDSLRKNTPQQNNNLVMKT